MPRRTKFVFNDVAKFDTPIPAEGLTFIIRTDANHATWYLKSKIHSYLNKKSKRTAFNSAANTNHTDFVEKIVHNAYQIWGHNILGALDACLDYERYGIQRPDDKFVNVHFYNARELADNAVRHADQIVRSSGRYSTALPTVYVTLDDLIEKQSGNWGEIAFSRHFSLAGDQLPGYTARPGRKALDSQVRDVRQLVNRLKRKHGTNIPVVLLEDNVRHARMLNWVIDLMDKGRIFKNGDLAGVATCFCSASEKEKQAIIYRGSVVPLAAVIDYKDAKVDVVTPRDFMFDGFVVDINGNKTRLPGIFMDVEKLFKIHPSRVAEFRDRVQRINLEFCHNIESKLGFDVPLAWFESAAAISHVTGCDRNVPMKTALEKITRTSLPKPGSNATLSP